MLVTTTGITKRMVALQKVSRSSEVSAGSTQILTKVILNYWENFGLSRISDYNFVIDHFQ